MDAQEELPQLRQIQQELSVETYWHKGHGRLHHLSTNTKIVGTIPI